MRTNQLSIDMDFRVIPSVIPLHSPSPDKKSINIIAPTISPSILQIKKQSTPIRHMKGQKQNYRNYFQQQTDVKFYSSNTDHHTSSAIKQKDEIIKNLKNIIDMLTQSSRFKSGNQPEVQQLKNQIKILTIQNQKLVNIIQKMSKNKNIEQNTGKIDQKNETRIAELMKTMKQNQSFYQQQAKQLKRFNKNLNNQIKTLENERKDLQQQNKKLLKILKQKNESEKLTLEKMKLSDTSENSIQEKTVNIASSKSQQRLSLLKIRQQHCQNLKMLKQGLVRQIQQTFDTMKIALDGMNSKIVALAKRLQSIQKMTWNRFRNTHIERQSITISIREGQITEPLQTDRTFQPEKRNNSQIYIEEGPSSSHERASRDQFTRLEQIPSQKNLVNPLAQELSLVRAELHELRFKYEKLCLDTSSVSYSQRVPATQIEQKYQACQKQSELKDKQIIILYGQIKQIETNSLNKISQLEQKLQKAQHQIMQSQLKHDYQYRAQQAQTQQKVKILVQNYEKQLQILRKQIVLTSKQKQETQRTQPAQQNLIKTIQKLKTQNSQLSHYLKQARQSLHQMSYSLQKQRNVFKASLQQSQKNAQKQQQQKQQFQQNCILLTSQVNQHKIYIQSLKYDLSTKINQFQNMKNLQNQSSQNFRKENEANKKLRQILLVRQEQISQLRRLYAEWQSQSMVDAIMKIQSLAGNISILSQQQLSINSDQSNLQLSLQQLAKLRKQNHELRNQLITKDEQNSKLQLKIIQLESLYNKNVNKLNQQQELYVQSINKLTELQSKYLFAQNEKQQKIQIQQSIGSQAKSLIQKIGQVRKIQEQLRDRISRVMQSERNI